MGVDFTAIFFYAMPIDDGANGFEIVEVFEELNGPLEVMQTDYYTDNGKYMLYVRDSFHSGDRTDDGQLIRLSDVTGKEPEWRTLIVDACIKHGLTFVEPDWYFATAFS